MLASWSDMPPVPWRASSVAVHHEAGIVQILQRRLCRLGAVEHERHTINRPPTEPARPPYENVATGKIAPTDRDKPEPWIDRRHPDPNDAVSARKVFVHVPRERRADLGLVGPRRRSPGRQRTRRERKEHQRDGDGEHSTSHPRTVATVTAGHHFGD